MPPNRSGGLASHCLSGKFYKLSRRTSRLKLAVQYGIGVGQVRNVESGVGKIYSQYGGLRHFQFRTTAM